MAPVEADAIHGRSNMKMTECELSSPCSHELTLREPPAHC